MAKPISAVKASMQLRGNNVHAVKHVRALYANTPIANNGVKYLGCYGAIMQNLKAILPQLKALYQATGKGIYIVGPISTTYKNGKAVRQPNARHAYNRRPFAVVQKHLLNAGIPSVNPACMQTFAKAIGGTYMRGVCGPKLFNFTTWVGRNPLRAVKALQRANKRSVRGCCAIVVLRPKAALASSGVQQELAHALKYNPVPVYRV
jgi:hypothetical protein